MATTIISTQRVADYATWRTEFDAGATMRTAAGVNIQNVFQAIDDSNKITIIAEVPSPEIAQAFFTAPEIQEAMQKGGVLETVEVKILSVAN